MFVNRCDYSPKSINDQYSQAALEPQLVPDLPLSKTPTIIDLRVINFVSSPVWWEAEKNSGQIQVFVYFFALLSAGTAKSSI